MKHVVAFAGLIAVLGLYPATSSAETPLFDPDQPFRQTFSSQMLRTFLNRALDVLEDHVEVAGDLSSFDSQGDQSGRFELKLYPKGKSRSSEHLNAEGWFHFSPDSGRQDFHLRFQRPQDSLGHTPPQSEDVL